MLIISRKSGESFFINDSIEIFVLDVGSDRVKIGIEAPKNIKIMRKELKETQKINKESLESANKADYENLENVMRNK
ncbi:MAG: carbon storage regulator CsrA [Clostridiales bacterium]|nr:carbon storage regulator CsrA [Clostridiales bacterium]